MTIRPWSAIVLVGLVVCMLLSGCGQRFEYAEVSGKVSMGGHALAGVFVTFFPDDDGPEQLPYSMGTTDANGIYKLTTTTGKPGALVGTHRVVVNWPSRDRREPNTPEPSPPIPVPYTVATDTPLKVEVKAGPPQAIDLTLNLNSKK